MIMDFFIQYNLYCFLLTLVKSHWTLSFLLRIKYGISGDSAWIVRFGNVEPKAR
jgi:hypothetical protein